MDESLKNINQILLQAVSSSVAIKGVFDHLKAQRPTLSLATICRAANLPSRGYFSDVMHGKRRLNLKYVQSVAKALKLTAEQSRYLRLRILSEGKRQADENITSELIAATKALEAVIMPLPVAMKSALFLLQVLVALDLKPRALGSLEHLQLVFANRNHEEVNDAIATLISLGLIACEGQQLVSKPKKVVFNESADGISHLKFLKESISNAAKNVDKYFSQRDLAVMTSVVVSVNRSVYHQRMPLIRQKIYDLLNEIESEEGDMMVSFNTQLFPLEE